MIKKPMLAVAVEDLNNIKFPVLCTPKLDGIRCLIVNGRAVSRKLKPIPNHHIRTYLEEHCLEGWDGEIIIPGKTFNEVQSLVMTEAGEPDFEYQVFDWYEDGVGYLDRMSKLVDVVPWPKKITILYPIMVSSVDHLLQYERYCLDNGFEGVMLRTPDSLYKFGRSTLKQGWLLKLKRFKDAEATVIGFIEKMHNANEAKLDELGHTKRSSHKENLIPAGTLGTLVVKAGDYEFGIGTGFDDEQRKTIWENRDAYLGKLVTFKYQEAGMLERPRFPVFKSFRHEDDVS